MKLHFMKALILGLGITFLTSGAAFASTEIAPDEGMAAEIAITSVEDSVKRGETTPSEPVDPNQAVSITVNVNEDLLKKQQEIDQSLFVDHKDELAAKGIFVTHTSPVESVVEIGITPYSDENAEFIYSLIGKDGVKAIEGMKSEIYETTVVSDNANSGIEPAPDAVVTDAKVISAPVNEEMMTITATADDNKVYKNESSTSMTWIYSLGALTVLGLGALMLRKKAVSARK